MIRQFKIDDTWTQRFCPACGARAHRVIFHKEQVPYAECDLCKTVFVNPLPPDDLLGKLYNEEWADYFASPEKIARDLNPKRLWRELAALPKSRRRGRVLDVGCQAGSFLATAKILGFDEVRGIDIAEQAVAHANKTFGEGTAICGSFLDQPFEANSFDVVTLWATLEHVPWPDRFLREAFRVLKPGGLVALSVPSWNGLSMKYLGPRCHMVGLEHLNYYTRKGMRRTLNSLGFEVETLVTRGFNPIAFRLDMKGRHLLEQWSDSQLLDEGKRNAELRKNALISVAEKVVDRVVRTFGVGDMLIVGARKPL